MAFTHYRPFTVDHLKIDTNDQTNFPVRIAGTYAWAAGTGSGGRSQNASGFDIRPFTDTGLSSALTYQLTSYNATTGAFSMVVLVPTLSHTVDYVFYIGIGDATLTTDGSSTSVWDVNFKAVYALGDGTTLSLADSTSNGNTLTNTGSAIATAGPVAGMGAVSLNGSSMALDRSAAVVTTEPLTLEALFSPNENTTGSDVLSLAWSAGITGTRSLVKRAANLMRSLQSGSVSQSVDSAASAYTVSVWNYAASTFGGIASRDIHANGAAKATSAASVTSITNADRASIGCRFQNGVRNNFFAGSVGEVRISNIVRAADWIKTTYNNLVGIASFYSVGSEFVVGGGSADGFWITNTRRRR